MFGRSYRGLVLGSVISALSGAAMLANGSINHAQLAALPKGRTPDGKSIRRKVRSEYIPAGPRRNCGHQGISPKAYARHQLSL